MTEFATIPKMLVARDKKEYAQKVPKIIWQTMKTNVVPVFMKTYADSWIDLNPEYEYRFCDDDDIIDFLKTDFPEYVDGYNKLKYGASKADLWRYLIMYKYGGVYADIDCKCIKPLREWIEPESAFVTQLGTNKDICQWLIISIPENPVFLNAAQKTLQNSKDNNHKATYYGFEFLRNRLALRENVPIIKFNHEVLGLSGPPVLQEAAEDCFRNGLLSSILPFTQIVCVSRVISCQMNGNVTHDTGDIEYKRSYKSLKLNHYNDRLQRIKRKIWCFFN
ncbi:MAG TPA: glycosyltransferase [Hanamia sp.]